MILPFKIVCIIDYLVLNLCLRLNLFFYIHTSVFYTSMLVFFTNKQVVFKSKGFLFYNITIVKIFPQIKLLY